MTDPETMYDLIIHGDLWDASNGCRSDRWLAIQNGVIEGIYESDPGPARTARSVETIIPGLIDMHVHLVWDGSDDPVATLRAESEQQLLVRAIENTLCTLDGGVTTVRDVGSVSDIAITVAQAVRQDRLNGPRVHASGRTIIISDGHDPFWGFESDGPAACRSAVRKLRGAGADLIKVSATGGVYGQAVGEDPGIAELSVTELTAIVDEAHRFDLTVAAHAVGSEGIQNAIEAGVDTLEHGNTMDSAELEALTHDDIAYDPTLYVYREIATGTTPIPEYARTNAKGVVDNHWQVTSEAIKRGTRILAGSDAGSPNTPHPSLHRELICLVEAGMTEEQALKAATLTAAQELECEELGILQVGTPADIVGYNADIFEDISATASPELVVSRGKMIDIWN